MVSNNSKYSEEMKLQTVKMVIEGKKSATGIAEELGIDKNTVCRWVRDYRRINNLPTYAQEKGIVPKEPKAEAEYKLRIKELEREKKEKDKEIEKYKKQLIEEKEKIEILKKSLHIFMQAQE